MMRNVCSTEKMPLARISDNQEDEMKLFCCSRNDRNGAEQNTKVRYI